MMVMKMNKYQEALNNLKEPTQEWLDNKLQLAENLDEPIVYKHQEDIDTLQELVDKATPKKPIKKYYTTSYGNHGTKARLDIRCPHCNSTFINGKRSSVGVFKKREKDFIETVRNQNFCRICSQAIDWSDEDE